MVFESFYSTLDRFLMVIKPSNLCSRVSSGFLSKAAYRRIVEIGMPAYNHRE
jgi:hypothetical protein